MCRCSYLLSMNTRAPRDCSTANAIGCAAEARRQHRHPGLYSFRGMFDLAMLALVRVSRLQRPDMLLVRPIDGHKRGKSGLRSAASSLIFSDLLDLAGALFPRKAYSRVLVVPDGI